MKLPIRLPDVFTDLPAYCAGVVRLQEIPSGSGYKNSSKTREELSLVFCLFVCLFVFDIFSSAVMNDLTMTFTARLKMDAKCASQQ